MIRRWLTSRLFVTNISSPWAAVQNFHGDNEQKLTEHDESPERIFRIYAITYGTRASRP